MSWTALPNGQSISVVPGGLYAVMARVKSSHTQADLTTLASSKWGLQVLAYGEQGQAGWPNLPTDPDSGHKTVFAVVKGTQAASIPWSVPWPASYIDNSGLTSAWFSTDVGDQAIAPTPNAQQAAPATSANSSPTVQADGGTVPATVAPPTPLVVVPNASPVTYVLAGAALGTGVALLWPRVMRLLLPSGPHEVV